MRALFFRPIGATVDLEKCSKIRYVFFNENQQTLEGSFSAVSTPIFCVQGVIFQRFSMNFCDFSAKF